MIVRVLGNQLELPRRMVATCKFEIDELLFSEFIALFPDSEEVLCSLVSEFGRVCKRKTLSDVGKVMGHSRCVCK